MLERLERDADVVQIFDDAPTTRRTSISHVSLPIAAPTASPNSVLRRRFITPVQLPRSEGHYSSMTVNFIGIRSLPPGHFPRGFPRVSEREKFFNNIELGLGLFIYFNLFKLLQLHKNNRV